MNLRFVQSAALLLWGWQSDLLYFAVPMAFIWEARFFLNRRWTLTKQDFYLLADLTAVSLVLMVGFLFFNRADYHFISTLMQWLPILFYPLTITLGYSTDEKLSLDVLFYSLRRQKQPVTQSWDMDYFLFGFLIVGAGTSKDAGVLFFPLISALVFIALLPLRSKRHKLNTWILVCCLTFIVSFVTQAGIRESHLELRKRAQVWLAQWIQQRTNPLKTTTSIGQIGRLKTSDKILYRVTPPQDHPTPGYLQEAVYDLVSGSSWSVLENKFEKVEPVDDFVWNTGTYKPGDIQLDIYHEFHREKEVIPLPPGTTKIQDLPAIDIQQSHYGVIQGLGLVPSPRYQTFYNEGQSYTGPPLRSDTLTNENNGNLFKRIVASHEMDRSKPVESIQNFFSDFRYSLYQPEHLISKPLEAFLLERKTGHCEFFATSTVMLLREMGVPARYVTGYSIQEYNGLLNKYVVRQRHAHAWALAYIDSQWQIVDTTPSLWSITEAEQATVFQPIFDLASNLVFLFQVWWNKQVLEDYEPYLYGLGLLLSLILLWRISRGEQVMINQDNNATQKMALSRVPRSPLEKLEEALNAQGLKRFPGELFEQWFSRIGQQQLSALLPLHYKLRFHPHGLTAQQSVELDQKVEQELVRLTQATEREPEEHRTGEHGTGEQNKQK